MLILNNLSIKFQKKQYLRPAVTIKNFAVNHGEVIALLGESGSGKTILSLAMMGLLPETAILGKNSQIIFLGEDLSNFPEVAMKRIRGKKISMIFQEPMTSLNPVMTVGKQIAETLLAHAICSPGDVYAKVLELISQVELKDPEAIYTTYPHELSGGMKQRIMIAMALACEPELLLADEPTSALDVTVQYEILKLLKKLQRERNLTIIFITHDIGVVRDIADRIAVMYAGNIVEIATKQDFFQQPLHPYSKELFASIPGFLKRGTPLHIIEGVVPPLTEIISGCVFYQRCKYRRNACLVEQPKLYPVYSSEVACILYESAKTLEIKLPEIPSELISTTALQFENTQLQLPAADIVLQLTDVKVYFPIKKGFLRRTKGYVKAVDGVSFQLTRGKTVAIVGESGCGKTTLAKAILRLIPHTSGQIEFPRINTASQKLFRKYAQIIFQDPFSSLNPRMLIKDIVAEGMHALNIGTAATRNLKVEKLLQQLGLPDDSLWRYPHEFSGGQRQRISIARALAVEPELIICDEPTSALDLSIQAQIINLLKKLQVDYQLTYLFISHNISVVAYLADEIIVMRNGLIVEQGPAIKILENPQENYTKKLIRTGLPL